MELVFNELQRLQQLQNKVQYGKATSSEMKEYLRLILKSSDQNRYEVENYVRNIGYASIDDFQDHLLQKNNQELTSGLLTIGGAVLLVYLFSKLFEK